jgi:hypothetical protein
MMKEFEHQGGLRIYFLFSKYNEYRLSSSAGNKGFRLILYTKVTYR